MSWQRTRCDILRKGSCLAPGNYALKCSNLWKRWRKSEAKMNHLFSRRRGSSQMIHLRKICTQVPSHNSVITRGFRLGSSRRGGSARRSRLRSRILMISNNRRFRDGYLAGVESRFSRRTKCKVRLTSKDVKLRLEETVAL